MIRQKAPIGVAAAVDDLEAAVRFFVKMGYDILGEGTLAGAIAKALYGTETPVRWVEVGSPHTTRGRIRLLTASLPVQTSQPMSLGLYTVDVYTTDMAQTLTEAQEAGAKVVGQAEYDFGEMRMKEGAVMVPGGIRVVFIEIPRRRPSVLDRDPSLTISEPYSAVCVVEDAAAAVNFFTTTFGLDVLHETHIDDEKLAQLMGLDAQRATVHMVLLADQTQTPLRIEVLQFLSPPLGSALAASGLCPGYTALIFEVDDLEATAAHCEARGSNRFGEQVTAPLVHPRTAVRGIALQSSQGIQFELWEPSPAPDSRTPDKAPRPSAKFGLS